jgi:hypothetical protein
MTGDGVQDGAFGEGRAISSMWLKQIASWEEEFTIAIFGLTMSSSVSPSARHCARLVAHRDVPGSKLLRSGMGAALLSR